MVQAHGIMMKVRECTVHKGCSYTRNLPMSFIFKNFTHFCKLSYIQYCVIP